MNDARISPDDPRLTAYALGELQGDDRVAVEAAVRADPALQDAIEQIRGFAGQLHAALASEPETEAIAAASAPVIAEAENARQPSAPINGAERLPEYRRERGKILRFPQLYFVIGGLAAACFAVIVAVREERPATKQYQIVWLREPHGPSTAATPSPVEAPKAAEQPAPSDVVKPEAALPSPTPANALADAAFQAQLPDRSAVGLLNQVQASRLAAAQPYVPTNPVTFGGTTVAGHLGESVVLSTGSGISSSHPTAAATPKSGRYDAASLRTVATASVSGHRMKRVEGLASSGPNQPYYYAPDEKFVIPAVPRGPVVPFGRYDLLRGKSRQPRTPFNTESYASQHDNPFLGAAQNPFSTFAVDVDTASYSNVRRFISSGRLPPSDAVRIEELLNYFTYDYPAPPKAGPSAAPFSASLEVANAPWAPSHRLVRIGLQAREVTLAARPPANLVFLLDVSGSMDAPNKLPLVKQAMRLLLTKLRPDDRVAIVTYAGASGLALPSTPVSKHADIEAALDGLAASGSTNGASGIELAYDIARAHFIAGGINRVVLCTDGDFNVGVTSQGDLARLVEDKAKTGVALTALGFGMGNYKDSTLELLADRGNGNYGYIDNRREAEKLLVAQVNGTLMTVAKDVKVQVDFNPAKVASYRLIGYEDRLLRPEDFNNDAVDAGEIGAGHAVTALYEVVPVGVESGDTSQPPVDASKYAATKPQQGTAVVASSDELLTVKVRYQEPTGGESRKLEFPLTDSGEKFADASTDFQFAAAVAEYGLLLRQSPYRANANIGQVIALASAATAAGKDPGGHRADFLDLARRTEALLQ